MRYSQFVTLYREHVRLMQELEEQAIREESKSHHDFLSACQAVLHHAPPSLKENLTTSYYILLGQSPSSLHLLQPPEHPQWRDSHQLLPLPDQYPNGPHGQKGGILCQSHGEAHLWMKLPLRPCRKDQPAPRDERLPSGSPHSNPVMQRPSAKTLTS